VIEPLTDDRLVEILSVKKGVWSATGEESRLMAVELLQRRGVMRPSTISRFRDLLNEHFGEGDDDRE